MTEENKANSTPEKVNTAEKKPPAKKKEKPPAIEDKPFTEFMEQHFTPSLKDAFASKGIDEIELALKKEKIPVLGLESNPDCWQLQGKWSNRTFAIYFIDEDIKGQKAFTCTIDSEQPSTLESFMIDERRVNLDLLVLYTLQRLNGQKWLTRN
ncbi:DUF2996 domain-containing protein [Cyanobacterium sp. IPPAS B-1200]|uniref:DUF2996 domain-containing protein n=1 Tax=Cyanobacterium sp. IPPAS B-1200 TaxID=1562720 RepID=UPI000852647A|nr:DUF2996 domain-containing protein [Cyanobacterium sp. IPPAS B-1200]OEJ79863.1 hypothetical protein A5482_08355 [Cyanobacterium sp. IPPAS B-1200]